MKVPHPIPYQGSKRALAPHILAYFPPQVDTLFEPFAGSAAISLAAAAHRLASRFVLNDLNEPLIRLWHDIINSPEQIADQYTILWNEQQGQEREFYDVVRAQFNQTRRIDCFMYLLVRCVKAAVRYNANGEFNQSPDNRRKGTQPSTLRREILEASSILKGKTELHAVDYKAILQQALPKDLVYMDPPYQGVSRARNTRYLEGLPANDFINALNDLNSRRISYIVSYDGRTGRKTFGELLPSFLELQHIEIRVGRSSQSTLLGRDDYTYESLYISPALQHRLRQSETLITTPKQLEMSL
jgi:DNA adenine methylase